MKIYNIFRVINELYRERYLGEDKLIYLKFFLMWLVQRKCSILKHHNRDGLVLYIDIVEVCHICSGTHIDYNFSFKRLFKRKSFSHNHSNVIGDKT